MRARSSPLAIAAVFAAMFLFLEALRAMRSPYWAGMATVPVLPFVVAMVFYGGAVTLGIYVLNVIVRRVSRASEPPALAVWAEGAGVSLGVWFRLTSCSDLPWTHIAAGAALLVSPAALIPSAHRLFGVSYRALCGLFVCATALAVWTSLVINEALLLDHRRADLVSAVSVVALGIAVALLFVTGALSRAYRWGVRLGGLAALAAALFWVGGVGWTFDNAAATGQAEGPNLVLVTCDSQRADYTALYGGAVPMASISALAGRGTVFDHNYSLAPWTIPSFYGMLTSTYPFSLTPGASEEQRTREKAAYTMPADIATLAEILQARGYVTAAFTGNDFLSDRDRALRGFDATREVYHYIYPFGGFFEHVPQLNGFVHWLLGGDQPPPVDSTRLLQAYSEAFLKRVGDAPFFLWVHFMDPHDPYNPPRAFREGMADNAVLGPWISFYINREALSEEQRAYVRRLYEQEMVYVDTAVGGLLRRLEREGLGNDTYVCYTSDHGEAFWDHGEWGHGQDLYHELLHVPLVFAGPGIPVRRLDTVVSGVDLTPTMAGLVGAPPDPGWKGRDLASLVRGEVDSVPLEPVFAQGSRLGAAQTVILGQHKLIRNLDTGSIELYDLAADPGERENRASTDPDRVAQLIALLDAWSATVPPPSGVDADGDRSPEIEETIRNLESFGYL